MKALLISLLFFMMSCQTLFKQPPVEFSSDDEFRSWFAFYYRQPDPDRLPMAIRYMDRKGYLEKHPDIASIFIAKVMEQNPDMLNKWFESMQDEKPMTWNILLISLWMSRIDGFEQHLARNISKAEPEHQEKLTSLVSRDAAEYDIRTISIFDPRQINMLWAAYSVTGDRIYVNRIIDVVELYSADTEEIKSQIGETAIMTLATNSMQYDEVKQICQSAEQGHPSQRTRVLLSAMLGAVENIIAESNKAKELNEKSVPAH